MAEAVKSSLVFYDVFSRNLHMTNNNIIDPSLIEGGDALYDEDGALRPTFVEAVITALEVSDRAELKSLTTDLHEAEMGDLITAMSVDERVSLVHMLGEDFDFVALTELDESIRLQLLEQLPAQIVATGVRDLDSDDAVYILEDLKEDAQQDILRNIPLPERVALERSLEFPDDSAGRIMQSEFIAVPPFWTVGQTIDYMREAEDLPNEFYEVFVVDPSYHFIGAIPLNAILRAKRPISISKIMEEARRSVHVTDDREEVARIFERYDLVSAPVLDAAQRLVGVITVDDIVDVIQEEAEEDFRALAGVGDEEVSDSVLAITRNRFPWLAVNLGTAVLTASVISLFKNSIEHFVALAVLMPIVASMGGNAATQTMTVTVRAIATRDIDIYNMMRVILRQIGVGFLNGVIFAIILGIVAALWFANNQLGVVIGVAMIINMVAAGLAGILIPIGLERIHVDPAIASSVFVTTVTDVVGFFSFLGLASWWFGFL